MRMEVNITKSCSWSFSDSTLIFGNSANSLADSAVHFLRCGLLQSQKISLIVVPAGGGRQVGPRLKTFVGLFAARLLSRIVEHLVLYRDCWLCSRHGLCSVGNEIKCHFLSKGERENLIYA